MKQLSEGNENLSTQIQDRIEKNDYRGANDLYSKAQAQGAELTPSACNQLASANAHIQNIDIAQRILDDMKRAGIPREAKTYENMIYSHSALGTRDSAEALFLDMLAEFPHPSTRTFNALISVSGRYRDLKRSVDLFEQMAALKVSPDIITFNMMLAQHSKVRDIEAVERLFHQLKVVTKPDAETYNIMIAAYNHIKSLDNAERMLQEMIADKNVKPGQQAFVSLIAANRHAQNYSKVEQLIRQANELEIPIPQSERTVPVSPESCITCRICGEHTGDLRGHLTVAHPRPPLARLQFPLFDGEKVGAQQAPDQSDAPLRFPNTSSNNPYSAFMLSRADNANDRFNLYNSQRVTPCDENEEGEYRVSYEFGALSKVVSISPDAIAEIMRRCADEAEWTETSMMNYLATSWIRALEQGRVMSTHHEASSVVRHTEASLMPELRDLSLTQSFCLFNTGLTDKVGSHIIAVMLASSVSEQAFQLSTQGIWNANGVEMRQLSSALRRTPGESILKRGYTRWDQNALVILAPSFLGSYLPKLLSDPNVSLDQDTQLFDAEHVKRYVDAKVLDAGELDGVYEQGQPKWTRGAAGKWSALSNFGNWIQSSLVRARRDFSVVPSIHYDKNQDGYFQCSQQWLLPLYCGTDGIKLVLSVIESVDNDGVVTHQISTVLPKEMAYSHARVISQPSVSWIISASEPAEQNHQSYDYHEDNENAVHSARAFRP